MIYRSEIDGLRAVAVLPVILFHAGFETFKGGFVGVDIFFVISGYLITTILLNDLKNDDFSIARFYERRARRVLPALFFVVLCVLPFAWFWMLPEQMKDFADSLMAIGLFVSNILFWLESDYFSAAAEQMPFLHTWSLAVEEQYYLLFPVLLAFLWKYGRHRAFLVIVSLSLLSLLLSEYSWRVSYSANFYLAPTRAWEIFAGSIAAFLIQQQGVRSNNLLAAIGLSAIVVSIFTYNSSIPFPSAYALLPVLGAVLIVMFAGPDTLVARLLGRRLFVSIGVVSYSAYLWHQPLFALARLRNLEAPSMYLMFGLCLLTFALAYLSWRFVEQPFRGNNSIVKTRQSVFRLSMAGIAVLFTLGLAGNLRDGFESRLPSELSDILHVRKGDSSGCANSLTAVEIEQGSTCLIGDTGQVPSLAIIGDSHASVITDALSEAMQQNATAGIAYTGSWCAPLMHFATNHLKKNDCLDTVNAYYRKILDDDPVTTLILAAQWANYTEGFRWGDDSKASYVFSETDDFDWNSASVENNGEHFEKAVQYSFARLADTGKKVVIVLPVPEFEFRIPDVVGKMALFDTALPANNSLATSRDDYMKRSRPARQVLEEMATRYGFDVVDPLPTFCGSGSCQIVDDNGRPLYSDANHLSYYGSRKLRPLLEPYLGN